MACTVWNSSRSNSSSDLYTK